jgi:hypothetical protein
VVSTLYFVAQPSASCPVLSAIGLDSCEDSQELSQSNLSVQMVLESIPRRRLEMYFSSTAQSWGSFPGIGLVAAHQHDMCFSRFSWGMQSKVELTLWNCHRIWRSVLSLRQQLEEDEDQDSTIVIQEPDVRKSTLQNCLSFWALLGKTSRGLQYPLWNGLDRKMQIIPEFHWKSWCLSLMVLMNAHK